MESPHQIAGDDRFRSHDIDARYDAASIMILPRGDSGTTKKGVTPKVVKTVCDDHPVFFAP